MEQILLIIISAFLGAYFNEIFRNMPVLGLRFYLANKNIEAFDLKIGVEVKKGVVRKLKWYVKYTGSDKELKNYFEFQQGNFNILKEGDSRYLFAVNSDGYKNLELWKYVKIVFHFKLFGFIPWKQELILDLKEISFEEAIKNKELIKESSYLMIKAKEEFDQIYAHPTKKYLKKY